MIRWMPFVVYWTNQPKPVIFFRKFVKPVISDRKNEGLSEVVIVQFISAAYVRVIEWRLTNEMPYSPDVMAEQVGELIERIV
jgi:hypothetical protein